MTGRPEIELKFIYDEEYTDPLTAAFTQLAAAVQSALDDMNRTMSQIAAGILTKDEARARMGLSRP